MTITRQLLSVEMGELPLTVAEAGASGAALVIVPSAFGVGADLEAQMQELASEASVVVALDPFFRVDPGPAPYENMARAMQRLQSLDAARCQRDVRAMIEWTRHRRPEDAVVILGICFGGSYALLAAADGLVDGVATWHGSRMQNHLGRAAEMGCPMRLHFGSADPFVSMEAVEAVRAAFSGRPEVQVVVHDGATHGFSHRSAARAYDERAEQAAMASLRELIKEARPSAPSLPGARL